MKKNTLLTGVCLLLCVGFTSCYSTRLMHGSVKPKEPLVQVNREWNHHLIAGLVPVGNNKIDPSEYVDGAENYVVKTNFSFLNILVSSVTFGIYTPSQTKFYIPLRDIQSVNSKIKTDE